jgi:hypothetical protein
LLSFAPTTNAIDACAGTGAALRVIADASDCRRYGIELESGRAASVAAVLDQVIHGSTFETHCPAESIGLLYLNLHTILNAAPGKTAGWNRSSLSTAIVG